MSTFCSDCKKFQDNEPCEDNISFCEYSLEEHDKATRLNGIKKFADWLVKYKAIPDGAMQELIRDFYGETYGEKI